MSKKKKKRNPQIEAAYEQGKKEGFQLGIENGRGQATMFFLDYMDKLTEIPGIGRVTAHKIGNHFLQHYGEDADLARKAIKAVKDGKIL